MRLITLVIVNSFKSWFGIMAEPSLIAATNQASDRRNDEEQIVSKSTVSKGGK